MNYLYPIFLNLKGKRCVVVGGGKIAERKIKILLECKANVTVISPEITDYIKCIIDKGKVNHKSRSYEKGDLNNSFLVICATNSKSINEAVSNDAKENGILCNVVDIPDLCNFFVPSVVKSGDLKIAISTNGKSPALAKKIRKELEKIYGEEYAYFINYLGKLRDKLQKEKNIDDDKRKEIFKNIVNSNAIEYLRMGDKEKFIQEVRRWILL